MKTADISVGDAYYIKNYSVPFTVTGVKQRRYTNDGWLAHDGVSGYFSQKPGKRNDIAVTVSEALNGTPTSALRLVRDDIPFAEREKREAIRVTMQWWKRPLVDDFGNVVTRESTNERTFYPGHVIRTWKEEVAARALVREEQRRKREAAEKQKRFAEAASPSLLGEHAYLLNNRWGSNHEEVEAFHRAMALFVDGKVREVGHGVYSVEPNGSTYAVHGTLIGELHESGEALKGGNGGSYRLVEAMAVAMQHQKLKTTTTEEVSA